MTPRPPILRASFEGELVVERHTGRARYVETDLGDGLPPWRRVVCVETRVA